MKPIHTGVREVLSFPTFHAALEIGPVLPLEEERCSPDVLFDSRAPRAMDRAAMLLVHACLPIAGHLAGQISEDSFRIGIYCAVEVGPLDWDSLRALMDLNQSSDYARQFRKRCPPKQYLKHISNTGSAHLGMQFGIHGPLHTFPHSRLGSVHAMLQALSDLRTNRVRQALVCSAFGMDDPWILSRLRHEVGPGRVLAEGAAALVIESGSDFTELKVPEDRNAEPYFGIATPLIEIAGRSLKDGAS